MAMATGDARPSTRRWWWVFALAAGLLVIDQVTKWWAVSVLTGREPVDVIGSLIRFRLLYNPGAAFGFGSGHTWVFTLAAVVAVAAIGVAARRVGSRVWAVALGLLLGGAASHLCDRLLREPGFARGHVVDFIDYNRWFVGNVADLALTIAAALIILLSIRGVRLSGDPAGDDPAGPVGGDPAGPAEPSKRTNRGTDRDAA